MKWVIKKERSFGFAALYLQLHIDCKSEAELFYSDFRFFYSTSYLVYDMDIAM